MNLIILLIINYGGKLFLPLHVHFLASYYVNPFVPKMVTGAGKLGYRLRLLTMMQGL